MDEKVIDLLEGEYFVKNISSVYSSDITTIANKYHVCLVIDLASRLITAHAIIDKSFCSSDLIEILKVGIVPWDKDTEVLFHSDKGSQYSSSEFEEYAKANNIVLSKTTSPFSNQVSERINGVIKQYLRKILLNQIDPNGSKKYLKKQSTARLISMFSYEEVRKRILKIVEKQNNTNSLSARIFRLSPVQMDK